MCERVATKRGLHFIPSSVGSVDFRRCDKPPVLIESKRSVDAKRPPTFSSRPPRPVPLRSPLRGRMFHPRSFCSLSPCHFQSSPIAGLKTRHSKTIRPSLVAGRGERFPPPCPRPPPHGLRSSNINATFDVFGGKNGRCSTLCRNFNRVPVVLPSAAERWRFPPLPLCLSLSLSLGLAVERETDLASVSIITLQKSLKSRK